ncbi:unnamed protein product [Toxocara canis]|uniref:Transmembrane protein n=1 Tax=Toxocara canis TaxID=6265 RepID=A0A183TZF9_TOXCA|nr:unnamed protein product [Toxocara canis]
MPALLCAQSTVLVSDRSERFLIIDGCETKSFLELIRSAIVELCVRGRSLNTLCRSLPAAQLDESIDLIAMLLGIGAIFASSLVTSWQSQNYVPFLSIRDPAVPAAIGGDMSISQIAKSKWAARRKGISSVADAICTMMTWLFALTVVWLCAPGNRRHENKASKQIRQQMAKLERIRQRDRERQRQFSDYEREREPYRHETNRRVESVVLVVLQRKHKDVAEVGPWVAKTSNVTLHEVQRPPDERLRDHTLHVRKMYDRKRDVILGKLDDLQVSKRERRRKENDKKGDIQVSKREGRRNEDGESNFDNCGVERSGYFTERVEELCIQPT